VPESIGEFKKGGCGISSRWKELGNQGERGRKPSFCLAAAFTLKALLFRSRVRLSCQKINFPWDLLPNNAQRLSVSSVGELRDLGKVVACEEPERLGEVSVGEWVSTRRILRRCNPQTNNFLNIN